VTGWAEAAEQFAEDIRQPGHGIAALVASAWCARVDPYATRSLVSAAVVLAGTQVRARFLDKTTPCPGDWALLGEGEAIEGEVAGMLQYAARMAADCEHTHDRAASDYRAAVEQAREQAPDGGERLADENLALAMQAARLAVADCQAALDILEGAQQQLKQALDSLRQLPAELEDTYEVVYALVRAGRKLPRSGRFLTGAA
jgi:hypothetical protein